MAGKKMRAHCAIALALLIPAAGHATVIHVPGSQPTIQAGIDAALAGDTVRVAPGTYTGAGNRDIDFAGKNILLCSEKGPDSTTIDCEGLYDVPRRAFLFQSGEDTTCRVTGFRITGGSVAIGGAIRCNAASPTIRNCQFLNNGWAPWGCPPCLGGALACFGAAPRLVSCRLDTNIATGGGAIYGYQSGPILDSCEFSGNRAHGIWCGEDDWYEGVGGAICMAYSSITLRHCTFRGNLAYGSSDPWGEGGKGGAVSAGSTVVVTNCTFHRNVAGGAMFSSGEGSAVYHNRGQDLRITRSLFTENSGGDVIYSTSPESIQITCTDIYGPWTGCIADQLGVNGNISADPYYCDETADTLSVAADSPCAAANSPCGEQIGAWSVGCTPVGIAEGPADEVLPARAVLRPNTPNPFNSGTTIRFVLPTAGAVELIVFDVLGRRVTTLRDGSFPAGEHRVNWDGCFEDGRPAPSGVYFCRLTAHRGSETARMLLLR